MDAGGGGLSWHVARRVSDCRPDQAHLSASGT
ncbi:Uncharacterised protein [Vibrio cholerae]|nr:Uncharacterised protein [Vibrio cholerae]